MMLALATLSALLCLNGACIEQTPFDPMPSQICAIQGQAIVADWMKREGYEARGYELAKWSCPAVRRTRI